MHEPHQAAELAFFAVFLDLTIGIHKRVVLVFQLNVNQRQAIDEKRDVKTAIPRSTGFSDGGTVLIDDFVAGFAARHFTIVDGDKRNCPLGGILSHNRDLSDAVFTGKPTGGFVGGLCLIANELFDLVHFFVCQRNTVK